MNNTLEGYKTGDMVPFCFPSSLLTNEDNQFTIRAQTKYQGKKSEIDRLAENKGKTQKQRPNTKHKNLESLKKKKPKTKPQKPRSHNPLSLFFSSS